MEATIVYWGYIGVILGYWGTIVKRGPQRDVNRCPHERIPKNHEILLGKRTGCFFRQNNERNLNV